MAPARDRLHRTDGIADSRLPSRNALPGSPARAASGDDAIGGALADARRRLASVALFSGAINLLTLSGSLYMLQVYDRVLPGRSLTTLAGLSVIVLTAYLVQGVLDATRARMLARIGALFDASLQEPIFCALAQLPLMGPQQARAQPLRDLDLVRAFLSGMGPTAFLDMPWIPIFLVALFVFHVAIGLAATLGACLIIATTIFAERKTKRLAKAALERGTQRMVLAEQIRRNAEVIRALGLHARFQSQWCRLNEGSLGDSIKVRDIEADIGALARVLRYVLQSAILGLGAWLVVMEQASAGIMVASSIMMGRALAPIEVALGTWRSLEAARQALERLRVTLGATAPPPAPAVALPRPSRHLRVDGLELTPPGSGRVLVSGVSFALLAGTGMALIGASGSGKSSLAKALVGIWTPAAGEIRLDGAKLDQWAPDALGRWAGYLPQEVALFDGTVADNIARFEPGASEALILEAAGLAGAHGLIQSLPQGYATRIGEGGALLSAGQRQRIGLARAVFGRPFLLVLDEPNANLDGEGEAALMRAILLLRQMQTIVIVISHRMSALTALDMAMVLHQGRMLAFGGRDHVLDAVARASAKAARESGQPAAGMGPGRNSQSGPGAGPVIAPVPA